MDGKEAEAGGGGGGVSKALTRWANEVGAARERTMEHVDLAAAANASD